MNTRVIAAHAKPYAQLARLSNAPTCITNTLVGCAIGVGGQAFPWRGAVVAATGVLLIYAAGMAMNDAIDARVDRTARPDRPIPSGRISVRGAYTVSVVTGLIGLALVGWSGWIALAWGAALVIAVVGYNLLHHRTAWSVLLMGACRGLVYPMAAAVVWGDIDAIDQLTLAGFAVLLFFYTVILTVVARARSSGVHQGFIAVLMVAPLMGTTIVQPTHWYWPAVVGAGMVVWLWWGIAHLFRQPKNIRIAVTTWLSGFCLVDAYFLTLLDRPALSCIAIGCWAVTAWGQRCLAGD